MAQSKDPTQYGFAYLLPTVIVLSLVFLFPIVLFLSKSILDPKPTLENFYRVFQTPVYLKVLWIVLSS